MSEEYNYSLYINKHGELVYARCAFKVICLKDIHKLCQGDILLVTSVVYAKRGIIIYVINGELYYHHHFDLYPYEYNTYTL